jgi:N-acetyl-anhydromuramyl-L-alanine amidase AmpD
MVAHMKFASSLAALALGLSLTTTALKAEDAPFTDEQKAAIETIIKDYIMANPEIIQEAVELAEKVKLQRMFTDAQ